MPNRKSINNLDILNTLEVSKYLKQSKFTDAQADALSRILNKFKDSMVSHHDADHRLATKADIQDVRTELKADIQDVRDELREFKGETKANFTELKLSIVKWQVGTMLILASLFVSLLKL